MPSKIIHIVKLWGKGGVEDYINSLQEVKNSHHEVKICSQISFFLKLKNFFKKLYLSIPYSNLYSSNFIFKTIWYST